MNMTVEEALNIWLPVIKTGVETMPECKEALNMAIKALKQIKWIPVSKKSPKDCEIVIASVDHEYVYPEARYSKEYGWEWAYESGADYWVEIKGNVDAWVPLPKPYKPESEDVWK